MDLVDYLMDILMFVAQSIGPMQMVIQCLSWLKTFPLNFHGNPHRPNAIHLNVDIDQVNSYNMNYTANPKILDRSVSIRWNNQQHGDDCTQTDL